MPKDDVAIRTGLRFTRRLSVPGLPVDQQVNWAVFPVTKFLTSEVEAPKRWSQNAVNILTHKYLRKAGVPNQTEIPMPTEDDALGMPLWLRRSEPTRYATFGPETSARQVFHRLAGCWTYWGWREGIFILEEDAKIFYDETFLSLAFQEAAPNSPQWFNTGLHWAYGIKGPPSGQWAVDITGSAYETSNSYERPQPHACFIQPVTDDLVNPGGIMDLVVREARLFKYGSGTGTNFSTLRGKDELLSGGGKASGLMSFLRIHDVSAGAIQSGGTTRRAAKMVGVDLDHPEIEEFVEWKMREERKARALIVGSRALGDGGEEYSDEFEGEAINTVSGQNSNNSVRIVNDFLRKVDADEPWDLLARTTGEVVKTIRARELWNKICYAAWVCADPGLQFHDTINEWHTCPGDGPIRASNPCSEYMFLDDTACNLASLNLAAFRRSDGSINIEAYEHAIRLWTVILEISVEMASFPSREIAENTWKYRTLGLGYMNAGGLLMRLAVPYDSDEGRALIAALTALMTGVAYRTSAELASALGPFPRWEANAEAMRRVLRNHARACHVNLGGKIARENPWEGLSTIPQVIDSVYLSSEMCDAIYNVWQSVLNAPAFRNAQVTVLAPTGTIHLVTDCDTSGIEPDFSLIKYKQLAGGGSMIITNQAVEEALRRLECDEERIVEILTGLKDGGNIEEFIPSVDFDVFDCANPAPGSARYLNPMAHVFMVAAVQPFLSGAVSKTINLPNNATVRDVNLVYRESQRLGLKAVALYRDGSKMTQPLSSGVKTAATTAVSNSVLQRGTREYPSWRREDGYTQKIKIGPSGQSVFLTVNRYPDGRPCEMYLELAHQGTTLRAMADLVAMSVSVGLQYGVPVSEYVERFVGTKFEPAGFIEGHDRIKAASSIGDYLGRELAVTFLGMDNLAQVAPAVTIDTGREVVALDKRAVGVALGYSGDTCSECGSARLKRAGACLVCEDCGATTGCG